MVVSSVMEDCSGDLFKILKRRLRRECMQKSVWLLGVLLVFTISVAAQDYPKVEVFGGYSYFHSSFAGTGLNFNGASGSIAFNVTPNFGLVGDFGGYHNTSDVSTNNFTYLFGPKF